MLNEITHSNKFMQMKLFYNIVILNLAYTYLLEFHTFHSVFYLVSKHTCLFVIEDKEEKENSPS